ncbi:MAG: hypothetical protein IPM92_02245 [Saprospiraceae bacterium]|nr:hypothetical protein [Saprospiraceae bacterium]
MKITLIQDFDSHEKQILQSLINSKIVSFTLNEYESKHNNQVIYSFSPSSVKLLLDNGDKIVFKTIHINTKPELETQQLCVSIDKEYNQLNAHEIPADFKIINIEIYSKPINEIFDYLIIREIFNKKLLECEDRFELNSNTCQLIILYNEEGKKICIEASQYNGSSIGLYVSNEMVDKIIQSTYPLQSNENYVNKLQFKYLYSIH